MTKFIAALLLFVASTAQASPAEDKYNSTPNEGLAVRYFTMQGQPANGLSIFEKNFGETFCQKTLGGKPSPAFACFTYFSSGPDAEGAYQRTPGRELKVVFYNGGNPLVGATFVQKSSSTGLCRKTIPSQAGAVPYYVCYSAN